MTSRPTLLIDLERCIGCYSCVVACKQENSVCTGVKRTEVLEIGPVGEYPDLKGYYLPRHCMHCDDPACVKACPTGASHKRGDGIVVIHHNECILCGNCIQVCPYGARDYDRQTSRIETCTLCAHRIDQGQKPACVIHCMGQALIYDQSEGSQNAILSYMQAHEERALLLPDKSGKGQGVAYLLPKCGGLAEAEKTLKPGARGRDRQRSEEETALQRLINLTWTRRNVYRFLSRIWRGEMDEAFWTELRASSFPKFPEVPELNEAYRLLESALNETSPETFQNLASDYATLLGADPGTGACLHESVYRSPDGLMMQDEWEQILRFYAEIGLRRSTKTKEAEDHLCMELECMAYLCMLLGNRLKTRAYDEARRIMGWQNDLLHDHLLQWVPSFSERVIRSVKTEFYRAMAVITRELLKMDYSLLKETDSDTTALTLSAQRCKPRLG